MAQYRNMLTHSLLRVHVNRLALAGLFCLAAVSAFPAPAAEAADQADAFMIVDCLLPGQVRQLGQNVTYVAARKAIKTSARECEIRGGEYVAHDRANLATALKTWLPLAEEGDLDAMVYVGEIFEKGLGLPADHEAAALWYQAAAEGGSKRAMMNLGALYEQGLGVPQDDMKALSWYRRAAGLPDLSFGAAGGEAQNAEIERLQGEVDQLRQDLQAKQEALDESRQELDRLRGALHERQSAAEADRAAVAALRDELAARRRATAEAPAPGVDPAEVAALRETLQNREAALARRSAELASLRDDLSRLRAESKAREERVRAIEAEAEAEAAVERDRLATLQSEIDRKSADIAALQSALGQTEGEQQAAADQRRQMLARLHDEIAALRAESEAKLEALRAREQAAARQAEENRAALAELSAEIKARTAASESLEQTLAARQQALAAAEAALAAATARTAQQDSEIAALEEELAAREDRLRTRDQELARLRETLAALEQRSAQQSAELARLEAASPASEPVSEAVSEPAAPAAPAQTEAPIEIIEPVLLATRGERAVQLRSPQKQLVVVGKVRNLDSLFSLTVNGEDVTPEQGDLFRAKVPLSGREDEITVVAINADGTRNSLSFTVRGTRATTATATTAGDDAGVGLPADRVDVSFGRYHALVIGNNDYRMLPALQTAVSDAERLAFMLREYYGFEVTLLLDATRYDILSALNRLRESLTDEDNLLVYYAGHGELDRVNQRGHWLPVDAEPDSSANWISNIAITDVLNAMSVGQLMVVADSCYSGTLTRNAVANLESGRDTEERIRLIQNMVAQRSRMVLTSGGLEPVLDSAGGVHSVFANALFQVLERNIGILAGQELFGLVLPRVVKAAEQADFRQVPEYAPIKFAGHESGDFFFVRTN